MEKKTDLRIVKTYHALQIAFTELMEQKTFEEITVNELCEKAMIRRTTFYKHFADKYEYFNFYLLRLREDFKSEIDLTTITTDPITYCTNLLREMIQFTLSHKKLVLHLENSNMTSFLFNTLQAQFAEEIRYLFEKNLTTPLTSEHELLIAFYAGGIINMFYWWFEHLDTFDEDTLIEATIKYATPPKELFETK